MAKSKTAIELAKAWRAENLEFDDALIQHLVDNLGLKPDVALVLEIGMAISYANMGEQETVLELQGHGKLTVAEIIDRFDVAAFLEPKPKPKKRYNKRAHRAGQNAYNLIQAVVMNSRHRAWLLLHDPRLVKQLDTVASDLLNCELATDDGGYMFYDLVDTQKLQQLWRVALMLIRNGDRNAQAKIDKAYSSIDRPVPNSVKAALVEARRSKQARSRNA